MTFVVWHMDYQEKEILPPYFGYDLHLTSLPGKSSQTIICFHGSGDNFQIAEKLRKEAHLDETLVSFNFPDHDREDSSYDRTKFSFGSIRELLPALYVLKLYAIEKKVSALHLYGFSAGGGALINVLATLNSSKYDADLKRVGIGADEKQKILKAIQAGVVILDSPLKSIEEIISFRGSSPELEGFAKQYRENELRPIDSLKCLEGLPLNILLYFEEGDEILSNRDDALFIERLQKYNARGITTVLFGSTGGHCAIHHPLWKGYRSMQQN